MIALLLIVLNSSDGSKYIKGINLASDKLQRHSVVSKKVSGSAKSSVIDTDASVDTELDLNYLNVVTYQNKNLIKKVKRDIDELNISMSNVNNDELESHKVIAESIVKST